MNRPDVRLLSLDNADGSISYSHSGYLILASANGPVEVQRRDELPEEAAIEVNIRPATGIGGENPTKSLLNIILSMHKLLKNDIWNLRFTLYFVKLLGLRSIRVR